MSAHASGVLARRAGHIVVGHEQTVPPLADTKLGHKLERTVVNKTGYEPADLVDAPIDRPELQNVRPAPSPVQLLLISVGAIAAVIGIVLFLSLVSPIVGALFIVAGGAAVAIAVLIRL
jgi:hypothetical protein